jgi:hypothetical protein
LPDRLRHGQSLAVVALLLFGLIAGCSDDDDDASPVPPPRPSTTSTIVVDYSAVFLRPVAGVTTTTVRNTGSMVLRGTVRSPAGPLDGATVRVERIQASGDAVVTDVTANADGRYELRGLPGGRYRIRAFKPPSHAPEEPVITFLAERQEHEVDLDVRAVGGVAVAADIAPDAPVIGAPVNLVVQVAVRQVGTDAAVRTVPQGGLPVTLQGFGTWVPAALAPGSALPATLSGTTDADGQVRFALACARGGAPGLSVRFTLGSEQVVPLELTGCSPPAPPPPTTTATSPSSSTSTSESDGG